ncbi:MAG: SIMPL domain-containing protein [Cyanobacteria bacterium J06648_16]
MLARFLKSLSLGTLAALSASLWLPAAAELDPLLLAQTEHIIEVTGQGEATVTADQAEVTMVFLTGDLDELFAELVELYEDAVNEGQISTVLGSINQALDDMKPITEADLVPILTALDEYGIDREALEIELEHEVWAAGPVSNIRGAAITFKLESPTEEQLDALSDAVDTAILNEDELFLVERRAFYTTNSCDELETLAYVDAVENARDRATVIADALGAELDGIPSVAEPSPEYSYYQAQCSEDGSVQGGYGGYGYDLFEAQEFDPPEISLTRSLRVTYSIR